MRGPLKGVQGILVELQKRTRLVIRVAMLGRAVAVEVNESDIALPSSEALCNEFRDTMIYT
jgi:transcription antitermination factor NusG